MEEQKTITLTMTGKIDKAELERMIREGSDVVLSAEMIGSASNHCHECVYFNKKTDDHNSSCKLALCEMTYRREKEKNDIEMVDISTHMRNILKVDAKHISRYDKGLKHGRRQNALEGTGFLEKLEKLCTNNDVATIHSELQTILGEINRQYDPEELTRIMGCEDLEEIHESLFKMIGNKNGPSNSMSESEYFIDTLEASYDEKDLAIMRNAIMKLYYNDMTKGKKLPDPPDFILCLKSGNQILANSVFPSRRTEDPEVIRICIRDSGNVCSPNDIEELSIEKQTYKYENWRKLLKAARANPDRQLRGILVDCAITDGERIVEELNAFNNMLARYQKNGDLNARRITKVRDAFALQANWEDVDDAGFKNKWDITIHRYFNTSEKVRELICMNSETPMDGWVDEACKLLEKSGLIRYRR